MEKDLMIELRLAQVTSKLQAIFPSMTEESLRGANMSTIEVRNILEEDEKKKVRALLRLSNDDFALKLHVIGGSLVEISMAASKFNMASAHGAKIKLFLQDDHLKVHFDPPNQEVSKILQSFFEIASASIPL